MVSYSRPSRFFEKASFTRIFTVISSFLIIVALPLLVLYSQRQTKVVQHASGTGYPQVVGTQILDGNGNPLLLRGAMDDAAFAYSNSWQQGVPTTKLNQEYSDALFSAMQSWGMNVVRFDISQWIAQNVMNYPYTTDQYMTALDTAIATANRHGLYVVADFHNNLKAGAPNSYADDMMHQTTLQWWLSIATRYLNNPMVIFDLENEPGYPDWCSWAYGGDPTHQAAHNCTSSLNNPDIVGFSDVTNAIRSIGVHNLLVVEPGSAGKGTTEGGGWNGIDPAMITDQDTIVSKHSYGNIIQDYLAGNPQTAWNNEWGPMMGRRPLYYGEYAVLPNPLPKAVAKCQGLTSANADQITNTFLTYMDSIHANWTAWQFGVGNMIKDTTTFTPTNFSDGAPWQCPDPTTGLPPTSAASDGMGQDIYTFLQTHPTPPIAAFLSPTIPLTNTPAFTPTPTLSPTPFIDTVSPSVTIVSPQNGNAVLHASTVTVTAAATDNVGVVKVQLFVNGSPLCTVVGTVYSCLWSVPGKPGVLYTIQAKAYDAAGNTSVNQIQVTSSN